MSINDVQLKKLATRVVGQKPSETRTFENDRRTMHLRSTGSLRVTPLNNERTLVMTYNTPELLKVGSAQALVLNGCDLGFDSAFNHDYASCREDNMIGTPVTWHADILAF
jgi:hypothetical protein